MAEPFIHWQVIDHGRVTPSRGWQVRVPRLDVSRWFGIGHYGSRRRALLAARRFRDRVLRARRARVER